jgi:hypothetical protein
MLSRNVGREFTEQHLYCNAFMRLICRGFEESERIYQMIIQLDAWNIRERDQWGQTRQLRRRGASTRALALGLHRDVFSIESAGQKCRWAGGDKSAGVVATREGIDTLRQQLHAEALRRGLGQAAGALVIGAGAVWIWRLADDRFKDAWQRLDFYHAVQHLATVGRALLGENQTRLKAWLKPLVRQLENESALKVVKQLEEILSQLPTGESAQAVEKELNYFHKHQRRMDYRSGHRRGEPIGSGAVESTCRQAQCRFKRPGQY